jgi:hypothetical protein
MGHPGMHNVTNHGGDERYPLPPRLPAKGASMISRRAQSATLSVVAGVFVVSGGLTGAALAEAHGYHLLSATNGCAVRPAAGPRVVSLITTRPRAAASPSATSSTSPAATTSPSPTASPTLTPTPAPTPTSKGTTTPGPSTSPVSINSPSPSPTPRQTPTPTPTATPTPTPKPAQLCVSVAPFSGKSVQPGHPAGFKIWVWSTVAEAQGVTVTATLGNAAHIDAPRFTVCPAPNRAVCTVGTLPTGQSEELIAAAFVRRAASAGERITLTATARGTRAGSAHSAGTINVIAASTPSPTASPTPTVPANPIPPGELPPVPIGELTSPNGDPSGLFPTVGPGASSSPSAANGHTRVLNRSNARNVSATLPLDTRLIGGQLAGLAVLAAAIVIAIARLSLRAARPHDGGDAPK